jgi:hypothetical protein
MNGGPVEPTVDVGNGSWRLAPRTFPGRSAGMLDGRPTMSTNASTLHRGSIQSARAGIVAFLAAILLAGAAILALNAGPATSGAEGAPVSDAQVQKALIDVRAGERASGGAGVGVPSAEFWAEFRAAEREMR